jgi:RNA 2',3'-cyclic 3'-phosphodiesterase
MAKSHNKQEQTRHETIRTFICIEIPDSIKSRIGKLQETLRQINAQISWTKPSNIHLTLKFLGRVTAPRLERVKKAVDLAAQGIPPFDIEVSGTGCFPSPRSARVLWVGITSVPEELQQLYANLEDELSQIGFEREKRKFSPHLTIARVRTPQNSSSVADSLIASSFASERFQATEVIVMRSDLKPTGSIYTPQATVQL